MGLSKTKYSGLGWWVEDEYSDSWFLSEAETILAMLPEYTQLL